jgi:hypothetical protein
MAEREGFEPSRGLSPPYRFSKPTPSASWVPLRIVAEGVGFEPTVPFPARRFSRPLPSTARSPFHRVNNRGKYNKLEAFGEEQGVYTGGLGGTQSLGCRDYSAASGNHIVNQQDMPPLNQSLLLDRKARA